jgi:hypothetical protein
MQTKVMVRRHCKPKRNLQPYSGKANYQNNLENSYAGDTKVKTHASQTPHNPSQTHQPPVQLEAPIWQDGYSESQSQTQSILSRKDKRKLQKSESTGLLDRIRAQYRNITGEPLERDKFAPQPKKNSDWATQ